MALLSQLCRVERHQLCRWPWRTLGPWSLCEIAPAVRRNVAALLVPVRKGKQLRRWHGLDLVNVLFFQ